MDKKTRRRIWFAAAGLILFAFLLWNYKITFEIIGKLFAVIRPIIIGGAIAFILNKPMNRIYKIYECIAEKLHRKKKNYEPKENMLSVISLVSVYIMFFAIIAIIILVIIPQLKDSIKFFADSFETYYANFINFINRLDLSFLKDPKFITKANEALTKMSEQLPEILMKTFDATSGVINGVVDFVVGFVFSVYVLADKKRLKRQASKVFASIMPDKAYSNTLKFYRLTSDTFGGFINGQLTEAVILGVLCFIGMKIFGFEYAILISVIIGITNIIPIFGPIIGTIPGALILLFVNPMHAVWFVVFIIVLQQLESNLIYPRVVGNSVGLPPLWTLIAITIGGGLFGLLGMLLSVPFMSIIYTTVRELTASVLKKKEEKKRLQTK